MSNATESPKSYTPGTLREAASLVATTHEAKAWLDAHADAWDADKATPADLCRNYHEISMVKGPDCYNCASRDGYPWAGRPGVACVNYDATELGARRDAALALKETPHD